MDQLSFVPKKCRHQSPVQIDIHTSIKQIASYKHLVFYMIVMISTFQGETIVLLWLGTDIAAIPPSSGRCKFRLHWIVLIQMTDSAFSNATLNAWFQRRLFLQLGFPSLTIQRGYTSLNHVAFCTVDFNIFSILMRQGGDHCAATLSLFLPCGGRVHTKDSASLGTCAIFDSPPFQTILLNGAEWWPAFYNFFLCMGQSVLQESEEFACSPRAS